jgi:hypothetical protein
MTDRPVDIGSLLDDIRGRMSFVSIYELDCATPEPTALIRLSEVDALRTALTARDGLLDQLEHDAGLILEGAVDGLVQRSAVFRLRDTIRANRSK